MTEPKSPGEDGPEAGTGREIRGVETAIGTGCAWVMVAFNTLLMGIVAMSFASGPYSSAGQEYWYRYGSLAFLAGGALLPAFALPFAAQRSRPMTGELIAWMILAFCGFVFYVTVAGGGV